MKNTTAEYGGVHHTPQICPYCRASMAVVARYCPECSKKVGAPDNRGIAAKASNPSAIFLSMLALSLLGFLALGASLLIRRDNVDKNTSAQPAAVTQSNRTEPQTEAGKALQALNPGWDGYDCDRVGAHMIWIGMSRNQLIQSVGEPDRVNTTVTRNTMSRQLIYEGTLTIS